MKRDAVHDPSNPSFVFTPDDLAGLLRVREGPCVSIFFPAHRRRAETRSDAIVYRNHLKAVERMLKADAPPATWRDILGRLESLDRPEFWDQGSEGVAVFAAPGFLASWRLPVEFSSLEVVGGTFHVKPLMRYLQEKLSFHLLSLSLHRVVLYEGFRDALREVPLPDLPASAEDFAEDQPPPRQYNEGTDPAAEKFLREVARVVSRHLKGSSKPLLLATRSQHAGTFRRLGRFPTLLDTTLNGDAERRDASRLLEEARSVLLPRIEAERQRALEEWGLAASRGQGSDEIRDVARAAVEGRVQQLFVESGRRVWGLYDRKGGDIVPGDVHKNAHDVDLLDEIAEEAVSHGGQVLVLGRDEMPTTSGIAATFRY